MKDLTKNTRLYRFDGLDAGRLRLSRESTEIVEAERKRLTTHYGRPVSTSVAVDTILKDYKLLRRGR